MGKKYGNKTKHEFPEPCQPTRSKCTSLPTKWRTLIVRPLKAEGCRNWLGILLVMRDGWKIIQLYYPICKTYVEDFPMPMVAWIFRLAMLDFRYPRNWKILNQRNRVCIHPSPIWVTLSKCRLAALTFGFFTGDQTWEWKIIAFWYRNCPEQSLYKWKENKRFF